MDGKYFQKLRLLHTYSGSFMLHVETPPLIFNPKLPIELASTNKNSKAHPEVNALQPQIRLVSKTPTGKPVPTAQMFEKVGGYRVRCGR